MNTIFWISIVYLIFFILYEPIIGYLLFSRFKKETEEKKRITYYKKVMLGLWVPTVLIFMLVLMGEIPITKIGFGTIRLSTEHFGFVTYLVWLFMLINFMSAVYMIIGAKFSMKIKKKIRAERKKQFEKITYAEILPKTKKEKKVWKAVAITAGVTEEILYRGFLLFALSIVFSEMNMWFVVLIASVLFGLAHTYQGFKEGVLRTALLGFIFSIFYLSTNSILLLIVFHILVDWISDEGEKAD